MTKSPGAHGNDLTADLLADLTRPLPLDLLPNPAGAVASVGSAATREACSRGPALEGFLRISPLDWCRPSLSTGLQSAAIRIGPIRAELGIGVG